MFCKIQIEIILFTVHLNGMRCHPYPGRFSGVYRSNFGAPVRPSGQSGLGLTTRSWTNDILSKKSSAVNSITDPMLQGMVAIVTGSSAGIGAAITVELSSQGAAVVINYPYPTLKKEAMAVAPQLKNPCWTVEADLSTVEGHNC
jgi:hypothetical protein